MIGGDFQYHLDTAFHYKSIRNFDGHADLQTPFRGMENSQAALNVSFAENTAWVTGKLVLYPMDLKVYSTAINDVLNVTANVDFNHRKFVMSRVFSLFISSCNFFRSDIILLCKIPKKSPTRRDISGTLSIKGKVFTITGTAEMSKGIPVDVHVQLEADAGGKPALNLEYRLDEQPGGYGLVAKMEHGVKFINFEADTKFNHRFSWDLRAHVS